MMFSDITNSSPWNSLRKGSLKSYFCGRHTKLVEVRYAAVSAWADRTAQGTGTLKSETTSKLFVNIATIRYEIPLECSPRSYHPRCAQYPTSVTYHNHQFDFDTINNFVPCIDNMIHNLKSCQFNENHNEQRDMLLAEICGSVRVRGVVVHYKYCSACE
ncbi:hypothetical protein J6590_065900 [Homalodisca vitripennis]|nr:hypothetical protein J6590_065900 [Homalodisca vitripennis]